MTLTTGVCLCGACRISFEGEPQFTALCYCTKCQSISGGISTTNAIIPEDTFKVTGPIKAYTSMRSITGQATTLYFCPECSSPMYGVAVSNPGKISVKTGILEQDGVNRFVPTMELNAEHKPKWLPEMKDMMVFQTMPGAA